MAKPKKKRVGLLYPSGMRPPLYPMNVKGSKPKAFRQKLKTNWESKLNLRYKNLYPNAGWS